LVLIWPPDSINEDSNICSLFTVKKSYFSLDTTLLHFVPGYFFLFPDYYIGRRTDPYTLARLPAGNVTDLPLLTRQSWYATSIGAATAIDE
jgi:hypothetical protein